MSKVSTGLRYEKDAKSAVRFGVSLAPRSRVDHVRRSAASWPGGDAEDGLMVSLALGGQGFHALNGGAYADDGFAASISITCADKAEVDRLWAALAADAGSDIMYGWLRDHWGLVWRIVPEIFPGLLADPAPGVPVRVFAAMTKMIERDIPALQRAAAG